MTILPVVDNTHMEGTVSQIFDIGPSFYFMIKNGKLFVIAFLTFKLYFIKWKIIPQLKFWDTVPCTYIMRTSSKNNNYFSRILAEIFTFEKIVWKNLFYCLKHIFKLLKQSILTYYISIDMGLIWLFINMKNSIVHDVWIYLESIAGSISFHTQTGTLYP